MGSFLSKIINYLKVIFVLLYEAEGIKNKVTLIKYYLKTPLFLINHLKGNKNSPLLSSNIILKNKYGIFFCGNNKYSILGFSSINEPKTREEMMSIKKGVVIDIGANGGMNTIPVAKSLGKLGKVISIEPEPKNFLILKKNIKLNRLKNVLCINAACYKSNRSLKLYLDKKGSGGHSLLKETPIEKKGFMMVKTKKLDSILGENKIQDIKLIKIDVEGAEGDVLFGAKKTLKKYHPKVIFEAWDEKNLKKCEDILNKLKYKIKKIGKQDYFAE